MAAAVRGAKQRLRAELKQRLRTVSAEERRRQSRLLTQKVLAHGEYRKARRVAVFLSMPDEVDTADLVRDIFRQGKACFVPRYRPRSDHMDMVRLASPEEVASLPQTAWGIRQPGEEEAREEALSTGGLDLIFTPGLGFDAQGGRLGRGRGYYDAYLRRCLRLGGARPYALALAFREQLCARVPLDADDQLVDEVLCADAAPLPDPCSPGASGGRGAD